jgi:hypothetical protein
MVSPRLTAPLAMSSGGRFWLRLNGLVLVTYRRTYPSSKIIQHGTALLAYIALPTST